MLALQLTRMVKLNMVLDQRCYFRCCKRKLFDFEFTKQRLVAGTAQWVVINAASFSSGCTTNHFP
jgi:hypothetical protein